MNPVPQAKVHTSIWQYVRKDASLSSIAAGLVAVVVSFGSTAVLMVQAG